MTLSQAIEELEDTRRRVRALSRPPPGHVPLTTRARNLAVALKNGTLITIKFVVQLPGRCVEGLFPKKEAVLG